MLQKPYLEARILTVAHGVAPLFHVQTEMLPSGGVREPLALNTS